MKRFVWIGIVVFLVVAACARPDNDLVETRFIASPTIVASPELSSIDSLMWRQPDSALALLLPYFDTCCRDVSRNVSRIPNVLGDVSGNVSTATEHDNHYVHLLLSELLYKNDYKQTNRRDLQKAVCYFDSLCCRDVARRVSTDPTIAFLDARAHYINGVGYYENDSIVDACKEYLKALEVMEERFEEKELVGKKGLFMAFTYTRLTDLFSDLYLHEQTIYFAQRSMSYFQKQNAASWYAVHMLNEIGSQYEMMNQFDSATCYYQKAMDALNNTTTLLYRDIAAHIICLEYKKGLCHADTTTQKILLLLQNSESDRESQARYLNLGEVLYHERRYDSAWVYLNAVFQATDVMGIKKQAAEWLMEIGMMKKTDVTAYSNYLVPFANQEENRSEIKSQLTERYKVFGQTQQERQHNKEMIRHRNQSVVIVAGWFFITLIVIALLYYFNKQHKQHYENQIEAERQTHKVQQAALAGRLKRSNGALKELLKHNVKPNVYNPLQPKANTYEEEPVCQLILAVCNDEKNAIKSTVAPSVYADIALTDAQKAELKRTALAHHASLFEMLKRQHPELKEKDFEYCYLCLLGLDNVQIAVMLQHSLSTIWNREKRLKKVLGSEDRVAISLHGLMVS